METGKQREGIVYLEEFTSRKDRRPKLDLDQTPDSLSGWVGWYLELAVVGMRSRTVAEKAGQWPSEIRKRAIRVRVIVAGSPRPFEAFKCPECVRSTAPWPAA